VYDQQDDLFKLGSLAQTYVDTHSDPEFKAWFFYFQHALYIEGHSDNEDQSEQNDTVMSMHGGDQILLNKSIN
jgi:hypothetical protein